MLNRSAEAAVRRLLGRWSIVKFLAFALTVLSFGEARGQTDGGAGRAGTPHADMPFIAPIGPRIDKYFDVPESAKGPAVDPQKGYRLEKLGRGVFMVTDNIYQSMIVVHEGGVVVVDAPPTYSAKLKQAIAEVSSGPVTHVIYSHSHTDHIGGITDVGGHPLIVAQEETKRLLLRDDDGRRPVPTKTFREKFTLKVGGQVMELSYHGGGHEPGNIFIYMPEQRVLMVVDVIFPGWMPYRRFAVAQDVPGYFKQVREIDRIPFEKLISGHVTRYGTHEDVKLQIAFEDELKTVVADALASTPFVKGINPKDASNAWALVDDFTDRVAVKCVNTMTPKWKDRLAAFDTFIWDQCFAMEQSLRID
jgi:glyoxylase-like metal-dependent hydrolase (beta-lactamase superfamily II)